MFSIIALLSIQGSCSKDIEGMWFCSVEEQHGDTLVFRPQGYDFPPVRGREKIEFMRSANFCFYRIAPVDGFSKHIGNYKITKQNKLELLYDPFLNIEKVTYRLIKANKDILVLILE